MRNRPGFTAIEIALVTAIVGLLAAVAYPKLSQVREQGALQGAKRQVITQLLAARASAIQRGHAVQLRTQNGQVWVSTVIGGTTTTISAIASVEESFGVDVAASHDPITFDARGYATSLPLTGGKFVFERNGGADSVCVTRFGTVMPECGL
jgi:prepilin-type N-terminal cleavage/methylation domain-containing protein